MEDRLQKITNAKKKSEEKRQGSECESGIWECGPCRSRGQVPNAQPQSRNLVFQYSSFHAVRVRDRIEIEIDNRQV